MVDKLFVPYNLALKLKEFGFNETCLAYYVDSHLTHFANVETGDNTIKAPLWQQAFDWLLPKLPDYNLDQMENHFDLRYYDGKEWSYVIMLGSRQDCLEKLIELAS